MARSTRILLDAVREMFPHLDAASAIHDGQVLVDGLPVSSPRSRLRANASVSLRRVTQLRGSAKLRAALTSFDVSAAGCTALDVGAAAGGFTRVLLDAGARRVYALDAGHGQLIGSLRQDPRVVNLEAVNIGDVTPRLVPEPVDVVTVDVSYLSLRAAVAQLCRVRISPGAVLVGLVKPMFELQSATAPLDRSSLDDAGRAAVAGIAAEGWEVKALIDSPLSGTRGARELLLHAVHPLGLGSPGA